MIARLCLGGPRHGDWLHSDLPVLSVPVIPMRPFVIQPVYKPTPLAFDQVEYRVEKLISGNAEYFVYCHGDACKDPIGALLDLVKERT